MMMNWGTCEETNKEGHDSISYLDTMLHFSSPSGLLTTHHQSFPNHRCVSLTITICTLGNNSTYYTNLYRSHKSQLTSRTLIISLSLYMCVRACVCVCIQTSSLCLSRRNSAYNNYITMEKKHFCLKCVYFTFENSPGKTNSKACKSVSGNKQSFQ